MSRPISDRSSYEGDGGWHDGRLGQAYDAIDQAFRERGQIDMAKSILSGIERLDEALLDAAVEPLLEAARAKGWRP